MIPDTHGDYAYARAWVGYLYIHNLINDDLHDYICMLLGASRLSKEEAQGIEEAEKLIPLFTKEFDKHLQTIQPNSHLSFFRPVGHIEIKL